MRYFYYLVVVAEHKQVLVKLLSAPCAQDPTNSHSNANGPQCLWEEAAASHPPKTMDLRQPLERVVILAAIRVAVARVASTQVIRMTIWQDVLRNNNVLHNAVIHLRMLTVITATYMPICMTDMQMHNISSTPEPTLADSLPTEVSPKATPEVNPRM